MTPRRIEHPWLWIASIVIGVVLLFWAGYAVLHSLGQQAIADGSDDVPAYTMAGKDTYPVSINRMEGPPTLQVGVHPQSGEPITVSCTTCHSTRPADPVHGFGNTPDEFHLGMTFTHGNGAISCLSCHNENDYDTLRAANGEAIAYPEAIALCAQCHSGQYEDYTHGAHGGMNGYWDLSQGPRTRNSCIDCHDPHAPAFPQMVPTFKPIDRGLEAQHGGGGHE